MTSIAMQHDRPCPTGQHCMTSTFTCIADNCTPNRTNTDGSTRVCGDDQCAGSLGQCDAPSLCVTTTGQCHTFPVCNHMVPVCKTGVCGKHEYCGMDCECHDVNEALPDLIVREAKILEDVFVDAHDFHVCILCCCTPTLSVQCYFIYDSILYTTKYTNAC
jgi:hypothetical protein